MKNMKGHKHGSTLDIDSNVAAVLSYFFGFVSGIVILLLEKRNKFVRFHALQSTFTFGTLFILVYLFYYIPLLGGLLAILTEVLGFILWVVLIIKAYEGERYHLPIVGELAERYV